MRIFNTKFIIDLSQCIIWQYDKAIKLITLIKNKENWYKKNVTNFIKNYFWNIFNIDTANTFGLNIWGKLLNLQREVVFVGGQNHYLTDNQYRFLLKGEIAKFHMKHLSVEEINRYLRIICNSLDNEQNFVVDNLDMTMTYNIQKNFGSVHQEIIQLFNYYDFLPRPSGVAINIVLDYSGYFGFYGANRGAFSTADFGVEEGGILL